MAEPRRIAVVIDLSWTLKHHHEVFAGTQKYAHEQGWRSVVWAHTPEDLLDDTVEKPYDGIIARTSNQLYQLAMKKDIPLVNVWVSSPAKEAVTVAPDFVTAGQWAADHLLSRGFTRFGFIGYSRSKAIAVMEKSFKSHISKHKKDYSRLLVGPNYNRKQAWEKFRRNLTQWSKTWKPPLGILSSDDIFGRYVANTAAENGIHVPSDLAIVSTQNELGVCLYPEPALSSIDLGFENVGYTAAQTLDRMMQGETIPEKEILLPPITLIPRTSTDAFAVDDEIVAQALRFIIEESNNPIKVENVAEVVPTSLRSLERRFRKARGVTIAEEIARIRIERAKRLLVETDMLVREIARSCGFSHQARLAETFLRLENMYPRDYRKKYSVHK